MVPALRAWHNPDEAAIVLVGLALVSSMPIAGSSTGWSQAAGGDMALSLGLVLGSTLLSPLTTPASLHALGMLAPGCYGEQLHLLAGRGTGAFLVAWVLLPSVLGIAARAALGEARVAIVERRLKIVAPLTLLVLCYANASSCLPQAFGQPDWDFLGIIIVFVTGLCMLTFAAGHVIGRMVGADRGQQGGAHVRPGHEQQRDRPGSRLARDGIAAAGDAADHRLQPGPAPGRGRYRCHASQGRQHLIPRRGLYAPRSMGGSR